MSNELHERIIRIESLMEIKAAADPETRAAALELVQTMMEFHNLGLGRMVEIKVPKPRVVIAAGDKHSHHRGHPRRYRHRFN